MPREIGAAIGDPSRPLENPRVRDRVYGKGWLIEGGRVEEREGKREKERKREEGGERERVSSWRMERRCNRPCKTGLPVTYVSPPLSPSPLLAAFVAFP